MTLATLTPAPAAAASMPDQLSPRQIAALAAQAKTPADHARIAEYYRAKEQDYLAEAKMHEAMVASYRVGATRVNNKNYAATVGHCSYYAQSFRTLAEQARQKAELHEEMAQK